jgi:ubiquinone/menaquinone biosynthesis C-methylase UbiE
VKKPKTTFAETSYRRHEDHYKEYGQSIEKQRRAESWKRTDTVDAWCRARLVEPINPLLSHYPGASWLTVGDGRYGSDAHYIQSSGGDALATDISDHLIAQAIKTSYISRGEKQNAEALSFGNETFDFAFCKDSLHHFPRPTLAIYEMLRVARKGIAIIEPQDEFIEASVSQIIYRGVKNLLFAAFLGRKATRFQYEEVGNFIYSISKRELEKIAVAYDYPVIAFKGINSYYIDGVEDELLASKGPLYKRLRLMLFWKDLLTRLGLKTETVLVSLIFKETPSGSLLNSLKQTGFKLVQLPSNPHIRREA